MQRSCWLIVCFDTVIVHSEFVPWSQTVNSAFYKEVLHLREAVQRKRLEKYWNGWMLHHNKASATCHSPSTSFW
jgi:hypothetical protein